MLAWPLMLSGLIVWGAHFAGVYGIASIFALFQASESMASRLVQGGFTLLCLAADIALLLLALRLAKRTEDDVARWRHWIAAMGAGLSFFGVFWQGLPALILG